MKKIVLYLMSVFVFLVTLTGCSSADPREVVKDAIAKNDGKAIAELYKKTEDKSELNTILVEEFQNKGKELSAMTLEEFKETPYAKILEPEMKDLSTSDLITNGALGVLSFLADPNVGNIPEEVINEFTVFSLPIIIKRNFNLAVQYEQEQNYVDAYSLYLEISNYKDVNKDERLIEDADKKVTELESKITSDLGVLIEMDGKGEVIGTWAQMNTLPLKATNNSGRDIKVITGYYVAFDKDGYPIKVGNGVYHGYFRFDDEILKSGESRVENAYPEELGMESCKFLITDIEYLNGGKYDLNSKTETKILECWEKVVVNK